MFGFVVGPEVLCKETSCDLSNLVKVYMGKYPINPLRGICSWLICRVLGCVPSIFVVETIVAILIVLIVPVGAPVVFGLLSFRNVEFCGIVNSKRDDRVAAVKVNVRGRPGGKQRTIKKAKNKRIIVNK
jgi:hypothetical protein